MRYLQRDYRNLPLFSNALTGLMLLLLSCNQPTSLKKNVEVKIRPKIQTVVDSMARYNQITGPAVGFAGIRSIQWVHYEKLNRTATLPELRQLTCDKNAVVRCYAFDALAGQKDTSTFTILLAHLKDTAKVSTFFGCMIGKEMVGDYFLDLVAPQDSTDKRYKLLSSQRAIIDSILLFDKHITLSARYSLLHDLKPQAKYYRRVKEIVTNEKMPVAVWTLAKYKKFNDIDIITKAFDDNEAEDFAIRSVTLIPDSSFYPKLTKIFEREWKEKLYDYGKWKILYEALALYPKQPKTLAFFYRTIRTSDKFRYNTLGADLLFAINKYPNPAFEPLKKQIKLDKY